MEIEAPNVELINEYIEKLGIDKNKVKPWGFDDLIKHYGLKHNSEISL